MTRRRSGRAVGLRFVRMTSRGASHRSRRGLPLYGDAHAPHAHAQDLRDRPVDDPGRLQLRSVQRGARRAAPPPSAVPSAHRRGADATAPPRVDRGRELRPLPPRPPRGLSHTRRDGRVRRARLGHRVATARATSSVVGDLGRRRPRGRQRRVRGEDPPFRRRRDRCGVPSRQHCRRPRGNTIAGNLAIGNRTRAVGALPRRRPRSRP